MVLVGCFFLYYYCTSLIWGTPLILIISLHRYWVRTVPVLTILFVLTSKRFPHSEPELSGSAGPSRGGQLLGVVTQNRPELGRLWPKIAQNWSKSGINPQTLRWKHFEPYFGLILAALAPGGYHTVTAPLCAKIAAGQTGQKVVKTQSTGSSWQELPVDSVNSPQGTPPPPPPRDPS